MTIEFSYRHEKRCLLVTYIGKIQPGELAREWTGFYQKGYQGLGYNALVDLSRADLSAVSLDEVDALSEKAEQFHKDNDITSLKVAYYAPETLNFGIARAYEGMAIQSVEITRTFRDLEAAKAWLEDDEDNLS